MLAVIVMLPLTSAEEKTDIAAFYSEMGGKEVNAGDFLKVIDPVSFGNLTNEQQAEYYKLKVTVPDLSADIAKTTGQDEAHTSSEENSRDTISSLVGKDITYAEFYDAVYPGEMEKLPEDLQELYKTRKVQWTAPEERMPQSLTEEEISEIISRDSLSKSGLCYIPSAEEGFAALRSSIINSGESVKADLTIAGLSWAYHGNRLVTFYSSSQAQPAIALPYMSTKTRLFQFINPVWIEIANKEKIGFLVSSQTVNGQKYVDGGYIYQVMGDHYGIAPIGYYPPEFLRYSSSQTFYVS